ncbi:helix-turn-helix transcriptional regulator [Amycolatopsis sp. NPDC102389]|uniref:helix-turn-helix transcriptional regulator n=1 Tax=Amycolatopsis sp. NPDC102389 TaxID=3363941 RepID=UPI0038204D36
MRVEDSAIFRVKDVAELLDVHKSTIFRAISAGELDALRVGKKTVRVQGSALNAWLNSCSEAAYAAYVEGGESPEDDDDVTGADQVGTETAEVA